MPTYTGMKQAPAFRPPAPWEDYLRDARALVATVDSTAYMWPERVNTQLRAYCSMGREIRDAIMPLFCRHLVVRSREDIYDLVKLDDHLLACAESLAILPDTRAGRQHSYCMLDLRHLFTALAPTLKRLFILHEPQTAHPGAKIMCGGWVPEIARMRGLEELVIPAYSNIIEWGYAEFAPGNGPGLRNTDESIFSGSFFPQAEQGDSEVTMRAFPKFPILRNLRRLAIAGGRTDFNGWSFVSFFPAIEHVVFAEPGFIEDSETHMASLGRQLLARPTMRFTMVVEDYPEALDDWNPDLEHVPPRQFVLDLFPKGREFLYGGWLRKKAMEGSVFAVGTPLGE